MKTTCSFLALALLAGLSIGVAAEQPSDVVADLSKETLVYVGTYTRGESKGIYLFRLQAGDAGTLVPLGLAAETQNPSYLDIDAARGVLFAANEVEEFEGKPTGAVSAYKIDRATGKLTLINQRASMGKGPCHILLDKARRNLLVANYGSGTVTVLPIGTDGTLGEATSVMQHSGSSVNPKRQTGPHAHCTALDPANRYAFACDLGIDKVLAYRFDGKRGTLAPNDPAFTAVKPGAGPRDMAFRPDGRFAYVANELDSTVTALAYDANGGTLKALQTVSTLPPDFQGSNSIAEVAVDPSGKWLYVSNRGHDSVALFEIDQKQGTLRYVDALRSGGRTPRHFGIEPSGKHLIVANQNSNTVLVTRIDPASGRLTPSSVLATVPSPVFVKFLPPRD